MKGMVAVLRGGQYIMKQHLHKALKEFRDFDTVDMNHDLLLHLCQPENIEVDYDSD